MATRKGEEHAANVLAVLETSSRPMSAYDLLDRLRPRGIGAPLTIYRALDRLMQAGKVHRIASINAFMACKDIDRQDHDHAHDRAVAFAICDSCGSVEEFVDPLLSDRISADVSLKAFLPRTSAIEVHGLCGQCRDAKA